jgi:hypothetical protein
MSEYQYPKNMLKKSNKESSSLMTNAQAKEIQPRYAQPNPNRILIVGGEIVGTSLTNHLSDEPNPIFEIRSHRPFHPPSNRIHRSRARDSRPTESKPPI